MNRSSVASTQRPCGRSAPVQPLRILGKDRRTRKSSDHGLLLICLNLDERCRPKKGEPGAGDGDRPLARLARRTLWDRLYRDGLCWALPHANGSAVAVIRRNGRHHHPVVGRPAPRGGAKERRLRPRPVIACHVERADGTDVHADPAVNARPIVDRDGEFLGHHETAAANGRARHDDL